MLINASGSSNYVAWNWKANGAGASSNTDGSQLHQQYQLIQQVDLVL
jgi:hypothetical protein